MGQVLCFAFRFDPYAPSTTGMLKQQAESENQSLEKKRKGKRGVTERLSPLKCLYAAMLPRVLLSAD